MNEIILCNECKDRKNENDICDKCKFYIENYCSSCKEESKEICIRCKQAREFLEKDDKTQASKERTDRNHIIHISIEYAEDKKMILKKEIDVLENIIANSENKQVLKAFECLTEIQRRRFIAHFIDEKTFRQIAEEEGVHFTAIRNSLDKAKKHLCKKILKNIE